MTAPTLPVTDKLLVEMQGHTALVIMTNPPANTWTEEGLLALRDTVLALAADPEVYALVLASDSDKFFSAGADLNLFADGNKERAYRMARLFGEAFETLSAFRGVSIAAINGWAMGGGLEVALACDIRIAEQKAVMALPEASVGLLPCAGGTQNLTRLVGEGWAKRMILCGERVNAEQAQRIGLVEEVVENGNAREAALALAARVAAQSPIAVTACKKLIQHTRVGTHNAALPLERDYFLDLFSTEDQQEGVNAFLEKRTPQWKNR